MQYNKRLLTAAIGIIALLGCEQQYETKSTNQKLAEKKGINMNNSTTNNKPKQYRIGGVPIKIGSGLLTASADGTKYPGDAFYELFYGMKINLDGSYAYFNTMDFYNKHGYDRDLYRKETEEEFLQHNWMRVKILIDFNIEDPSSTYQAANDSYPDKIERYIKRGELAADGERYGLHYYKFIAQRDYGREEYYLKYFPEGSWSNVETVIRCTLGIDEAHSRCEQSFTIPGTVLSAILSYRKPFLPHWQFIQDTFIERFNADLVQHDAGGE